MSVEASTLLQQLLAVQMERAAAPSKLYNEASLLGAREAESSLRASSAVASARVRVNALLSGVPAALLILAGSRAAMGLTSDQRLALEMRILALEEEELLRSVALADADAEAAGARESSARAQMELVAADRARVRSELERIKVGGGWWVVGVRVCVPRHKKS